MRPLLDQILPCQQLHCRRLVPWSSVPSLPHEYETLHPITALGLTKFRDQDRISSDCRSAYPIYLHQRALSYRLLRYNSSKPSRPRPKPELSNLVISYNIHV